MAFYSQIYRINGKIKIHFPSVIWLYMLLLLLLVYSFVGMEKRSYGESHS
ncbi:hypothetical protein F383_16532 [Gossypium arboreum]|uniref:Uncharacterized protein n=1 Tax=Gossypium arboreum TaxID=29729 RepID=A0A0B0PUN8_GOSAR|nr:hypothetical protein F383_16532 [Gossypium arboreum]